MDKVQIFKEFLESISHTNPALIESIKQSVEVIFENEKGEGLWAKKVHPDEGKMHKLLGLKEGEKIVDKYTSGKKLAQDLLKANKGDKRKTGGQLGFVANVGGPNKEVFSSALSALKDLD